MSNKKNKWKTLRTLLVILFICIGVLAAFVIKIQIDRASTKDLSLPYTDMATSDYSNLTSFKLQTGKSFASNLAVSGASVPCGSLSLSNSAEKALLVNTDTCEMMYAYSIYDRIFPASITKIMTAILVEKYGNLNDLVVMEESDFQLEEGSQSSDLMPGDQVTMDQLYHLLLVHSANDAAMAIARHISGSVSDFVVLMNTEARALGMTGTNFVNPHGLQDANHYTTAYDVYLMMNEACKYADFRTIIAMPNYMLRVTRGEDQAVYYYDATDKYLNGEHSVPDQVYVIGGKTGTTSEAGACLAILSQNTYGIPFISVVMNAYKKADLYNDMDQLLMQIN